MRLVRLLSVLLFLVPLTGMAKDPVRGAMGVPADASAALADIRQTLGFVPEFLQKFPAVGLAGAWEEMKSLQMNPSTALSGKDKELIGLAVSAQIPCTYCVYAHTQFAKNNGATDEEIGEAVVVAALERHWSTVLNGQAPDEKAFQKWADDSIAHGARMQKSGAAPTGNPVTDAASAYRDMTAMFGSVPDFAQKFPPGAIGGAWKEAKAVEFSETKLSMKTKSLVGLAVASQIPCKYCVYIDTKSAKQAGATDQEIGEAIAMAAVTRHWSTYLNGLRLDEKTFRRDVDRIINQSKKGGA